MREVEPALKDDLAGGWHYEEDAHLRSDLLMSGLKKNLLAKGVEILENRTLTGLRENEQGLAARTDRGEIPAKRLVLATGALTPKVGQDRGLARSHRTARAIP